MGPLPQSIRSYRYQTERRCLGGCAGTRARHLASATLAVRLASALVTLAIAGAVVGPAAASTSSTAVPGGEPVVGPGLVQLSDERTFTRWVHVVHGAGIHVGPDSRSPRFAKLHFLTEDDFPEVYLVLLATQDAQGNEWVKVRIPMRPNGRVGWVRRDALGPFHSTNQLLVVDRRRLRIHLFVDGQPRWSAPVAIGKPASPTPAGHFWIREWFKIRDHRSGYWPYALGTAAYSRLTDWPGGGVVGIHGPYYQPRQIPGRLSHGCIRLRAQDDGWLGRHVGIGTPLQIV